MAATGNQLFFAASNYQYGEELYSGLIAPASLSVVDGNWNNPNIWTGKMVPSAGADVIIKNKITGNNIYLSNKIKSPRYA